MFSYIHNQNYIRRVTDQTHLRAHNELNMKGDLHVMKVTKRTKHKHECHEIKGQNNTIIISIN